MDRRGVENDSYAAQARSVVGYAERRVGSRSIAPPFLPVLAWSVSLSVVCFPVYQFFLDRFKNENAAAACAVLLIGVGIFVPVTFVIGQVTSQAVSGVATFSKLLEDGKIDESFDPDSTGGST